MNLFVLSLDQISNKVVIVQSKRGNEAKDKPRDSQKVENN